MEKNKLPKEVIDVDKDFVRQMVATVTNRKDKRDRIKYFTKMLIKHLQVKPAVKTLPSTTEEKAEQDYQKLNVWIIRKVILENKIKALTESVK